MTWQLYIVISVLSLSVSIVLQRILIHNDKLDPVAYASFFQFLVGVFLILFVAFTGWRTPNLSGLWLPAVGSMVLYGAGHVVYAKTLQRVEASVFSVLFATHAVWVMILGILFFDESLTLVQIAGSILIFAGVLFVTNSIKRLKLDLGTMLGLLTGVLFGLAITMWSYVGRNADTLSWAAFSFFGAGAAALIFSPYAFQLYRSFLKTGIISRLTLLAIFYAIGSASMLYAYKLGTLSVVSPIRQTGIIVTVLLALLLIPKERKNISRKLIASAVCTLGFVLIVL